MNNSDIVLWSYSYYQAHKKEIDTIRNMTEQIDKIPVEPIRKFLTQTLLEYGYKIDGFTPVDWTILAFEVYAQITRFRFGPGAYTQFENTKDPFIELAIKQL